MGGNGFYWRVAKHPELDHVLEIRRAEGGIRTWAAEPGEYFMAFDGNYGGLWRRNGRPPQMLAGVGFTSQGPFDGAYYRRMPDADNPRAAWILDGVGGRVPGRLRAQRRRRRRLRAGPGRPPPRHALHALILARSEGHHGARHRARGKCWGTSPPSPANRSPTSFVRKIVYFETANGGAVFSVGSITFCGSLAHNDYDNNISHMIDNVVAPVHVR